MTGLPTEGVARVAIGAPPGGVIVVAIGRVIGAVAGAARAAMVGALDDAVPGDAGAAPTEGRTGVAIAPTRGSARDEDAATGTGAATRSPCDVPRASSAARAGEGAESSADRCGAARSGEASAENGSAS